MQGKSDHVQADNMEVTGSGDGGLSDSTTTHARGPAPKVSPPGRPCSPFRTVAEEEEEERAWRAYRRAALIRDSDLNRSRNIKGLIHRFSGSGPTAGGSLPDTSKALRMSTVFGYGAGPVPTRFHSIPPADSPSIMVTPPTSDALPREAEAGAPQGGAPSGGEEKPGWPLTGTTLTSAADKPKTEGSGRGSVSDSGVGSESDFDPNKRLNSSPSDDDPPMPKALPTHQNPKYQLYLGGGDVVANGSGGGENGRRLSRWERSGSGFGFGQNYRGSLESLASRDWDTMSDRVGGFDSPPRVFNSPYATAVSMDYNPMSYRMAEVKGGMSPATSEMNLYSFNSRSTSPVPPPGLTAPRSRFSTFDTLSRRRAEVNNTVIPTHHMTVRQAPSMAAPNKRDFIEELTKQLNECQKRNQFLEAESVELDKERNQIRFEMRGLLVNNEDLLRTNSQLTIEMKKMGERMMELERDNVAMTERFRHMDVELKEAREMMVEANTQEYAFNFLQQSLKNKIKDAEENLEKQTQQAQSLAEKLWLTERQLEEMEVDRETRDKKSSDLSITVLRLEDELAEALQSSTQAQAELSLQQKLRMDTQMRVDELEESLLEKSQELQRAQDIVCRLQGEVSGKLSDKDRTLEEEIQLRERMQLQWKQAERSMEDLRMELQTAAQAKEDLVKQLKYSQEKLIDLESDLEEMHDSEQRWAAKQKRTLEQMEQLQLKLLQAKDINDQVDCEKAVLERQMRELRLEVENLQNNTDQVDAISKTESRAKDLESQLRAEERNKMVLNNTIGKLERKIKELTDQLEEEVKISSEQKDLMTQRMRSLKRQLSEAEEEVSRKDGQYRHTQRELTEERENSAKLQRQLLDQHLQVKRNDTLRIRQTLDNLRLDLSVEDEDYQPTAPPKTQSHGQLTSTTTTTTVISTSSDSNPSSSSLSGTWGKTAPKLCAAALTSGDAI